MKQWLAIAVCVLLNVLDGFDLLVMAFTAPAVAGEWQLSGTQLGLVLSSAPVGMAAGSLVVAPNADRVGRRKVILGCLLLSSSGMVLSMLSHSVVQLASTRLLTGIGIGGVLAASSVIASEYANRRWRGLAVSLNGAGYAIGASASGIIAVTLHSSSGWRSTFAWGAIGTALLVPVALRWLPESLEFLQTRRSPSPDRWSRARRILCPAWRRATLLLWVGFFVVMFTFYFVVSWTPKLLAEAGMATGEGITGGIFLNLGGILGATLFGLLTTRLAPRGVIIGYMAIAAPVLAAVVHAVHVAWLTFALGWLIGMLVNGCISGMYALGTWLYPSEIRATGVGWAIGVGRAGAITGPFVAGHLLDAGWPVSTLYLLVAAILLLGVPAVLAVRSPHHAERWA
ncbi:MFS transporter [Nonomuraea zeae]|nr:aromatic acid/H+ symport family MFS transporter [Nonomuraea zeae]